jgi:hypothetical protein
MAGYGVISSIVPDRKILSGAVVENEPWIFISFRLMATTTLGPQKPVPSAARYLKLAA